MRTTAPRLSLDLAREMVAAERRGAVEGWVHGALKDVLNLRLLGG